MGSKYMINCAKYPFKGLYDMDYQSNNLFKAFVFLVKAMFQYEIIDIQIRNHDRMSKVDLVYEYDN